MVDLENIEINTVPTRRSSDLKKRGYQEVITPHIGNLELYKTSGHYPYYQESQYNPLDVDDERYLRSEEHTSELQSRGHLVCRLLLEKRNIIYTDGGSRNHGNK